jgi:endonuclease/exonuclease/phosphatase (EEP) superfamily protein YafD
MSSMTYPPTTSERSEWLQRSVTAYFATLTWTAPIAAAPAATAADQPPRSLDLSVVQYFANFPWGGAAAVLAAPAGAQDAAAPDAMLDPATIGDWLDFEPTVDPEAILDGASQDDSGSLADFSDFF